MIPEGRHPATVLEGWTEADEQSGDLTVCVGVDIEIPDGEPIDAVARHRTTGDYGHLGKAVVLHLGLPWPDGLKDMSPCKGKKIFVKVKHKTSQRGEVFENVYIDVGRQPKPATPEQVEMALAKLEAKQVKDDGSGLPF